MRWYVNAFAASKRRRSNIPYGPDRNGGRPYNTILVLRHLSARKSKNLVVGYGNNNNGLRMSDSVLPYHRYYTLYLYVHTINMRRRWRTTTTTTTSDNNIIFVRRDRVYVYVWVCGCARRPLRCVRLVLIYFSYAAADKRAAGRLAVVSNNNCTQHTRARAYATGGIFN